MVALQEMASMHTVFDIEYEKRLSVLVFQTMLLTNRMRCFVILSVFLLFSDVYCEEEIHWERFRRQNNLPPLTPFSCKVKIYENTRHNADFLTSWRNVPKLDDCIGYCAQYQGGGQCRGINFFNNSKTCEMLSQVTSNPNAEMVPSWANIRHAAVLSCDGRPVVTTTPAPKTGECGQQSIRPKIDFSNAWRNRIINGDDAIANSWPWIVSITYYGKHVCGGSLIPVSPGLTETDVVLTAAHCVKNQAVGPLNVANVAVIAGSHSQTSVENGEQTSNAESLHWHDYFMDDGLMNDIALIKLKTPIKFSRTVSPICLPSLKEATAVDSVCMAAGWGRYINNNDKTLADKLQQLRVPIVDSITCKNSSVWGGNVNTATMLCAGSMNGRQNVCVGDSGGALMCLVGNRWVQHGIVSFVYRQDCAAAKKPGVYTRVSMYRSWIDGIIGKRSAVFKKAKRHL